MDIRVINRKKEIINVSNLSIMSMDKWLVGMNDKGEIVRIEEYKDKDETKEKLEAFGIAIEEGNRLKEGSIIIRT